MHRECAVLISRKDVAWVTELKNISASGVSLKRPREFNGELHEEYVLDMVFSDDVLVNVDAELIRMTETELGFSFTRIPANKEGLLWGLLGAYADSFEL